MLDLHRDLVLHYTIFELLFYFIYGIFYMNEKGIMRYQ